nr:hypothetical protein [Luteibacter rhizovicinus]
MNIRIVLATAMSLSLAMSVVWPSETLHASSASDPSAGTAAAAVPITIDSNVPKELNASGGGAQKAVLSQAAAFAWQEFIALNWPAVNQSGFNGQRDTPNTKCLFGDPSCDGPLVWETFRSKVEIFPGKGVPPGYVNNPNTSFGYDALPAYNYDNVVPACGATSTSTAWVNLDETDQITLDDMYAGAAPTQVAGNSSPQLIRFTAKANRTEYAYVANNQWWTAVPGSVAQKTQTYLETNKASPPPGSSQYVSLPLNTIEMKAGWRELTTTEQQSGRFHMAKVRSYETNTSKTTCYREAVWGLVALHIIQKTATAPHFIYATFEQADNILRPNGTPLEDENGAIAGALPACRSDQKAPCPTIPAVTLDDTATVSPSGLPPEVDLVPASAQYCTPSVGTRPKNQLYYQNSDGKPGLPAGGFICVNYRDNAIPNIIVQANKDAHAAMATYANAHGQNKPSPWAYYKLVNVQFEAVDKDYAGVYKTNDPYTGRNPASYHLANIVVETNRPLQLFSGGLVGSGYTGVNSDYESQFGGTGIHKNMFYGGGAYNMGGCMGCHGSQGQHASGDFSVILANGAVHKPEPPSVPSPSGATEVVRNRTLK